MQAKKDHAERVVGCDRLVTDLQKVQSKVNRKALRKAKRVSALTDHQRANLMKP